MSHKTSIDDALFRHLVDNSNIPLIGSAAGSLLVAMAHMYTPNSKLVFGWMLLVLLTVGVRYWLVQRCRARLNIADYNESQAMRYALTLGMSGIAWGLGGLFVVNTTPIATVVVITAIQAMVMGGALTLGAFMPAFYAFAIPATMPMVIVLLTSKENSNFVLALCTIIFLLLFINIAKRFSRALGKTLQLTFEKQALVNALTEAYDQQTVLAKTDGLTRLANRRHFDEVLDKEIARLQRSGEPLSLLILDVDHFKAFNDTYGHIAGDECLKQIADIFQRHLNRTTDLAARYGGEEFAGVMPETGHAGTILLAEQIRVDVAALKIPHSKSPTAQHVTISLGVATLNCAELESSNHAISLTDKLLYRAKSEGRNRVVALNALEIV
ncbi:MAG TPA: diguanylate cyclase [Methylophilaceae bacterium]